MDRRGGKEKSFVAVLAGHIRDGTLQAGVLSGKACPREGTVGMSHTRVLSGEERGERMLSSPR